MPSRTIRQAQLQPTAHPSGMRPWPQRIRRAIRRQHEILIIQNLDTGWVRYVRCPLKINAGRSRTVAASKDRRWQTAGSQIFFQCA